MIKRYGMSEALGPRTFGKREELVFLGREISEERDYGDKVAEEIDEEVKELIDMSYRRAEEILVTHKPKLVRLAEYLIEHETLSGDNLARVLEDDELGDEPGTPAVPVIPPETPPYTPAPAPSPVPRPAPTLPSQLGVSPRPGSGDADG
jgi:cell division protease FtsH